MKGEVSLYFRSSILRKLKPKELMTKNGQSKEREREVWGGGAEEEYREVGKAGEKNGVGKLSAVAVEENAGLSAKENLLRHKMILNASLAYRAAGWMDGPLLSSPDCLVQLQ